MEEENSLSEADLKERSLAVIKKTGNEFCIFSKTGEKLGRYPTKESALERLRQIEFFKSNSSSDVVFGSFKVKEAPDDPRNKLPETNPPVKAVNTKESIKNNKIGQWE